MADGPPPWSNMQLRRVGESIRDGTPLADGNPTYGAVMLWYNDLAAAVQERIGTLDWVPLLGSRTPEVTSRPKTIDTLRQKLQRDHGTPLPNVQDVAGVRFEAEMSLDEQDTVADAIAQMFGGAPAASTHDIRANPHSGYRAVHLWLRLPQGRVEVQIRTHLQSAWANMYENAADLFGRNIRYDWLPTHPEAADMVRALQEISTVRLAQMERDRNEIEQLERAMAESRARREASGVVVASTLKMEDRLLRIKERYRSSEVRTQRQLDDLREFFADSRSPRRES